MVFVKGRINYCKFVRPSLFDNLNIWYMILMCFQPILSPATVGP